MCVLLLAGKRSDRVRKRRPAKIVSFDTDDTKTTSMPAFAVSNAKTPTSSCELDDSAVDAMIASENPISSCSNEALEAGSVFDNVTESSYVSSVADKNLLFESDVIETSSVGPTLYRDCVESVDLDFSRHRTLSLPNMGKQFSSKSCSDDVSQDITSSSSSTVKPDNFEGPQNLPSDNSWFSSSRERVSRVKSADAESIGSNASTASNSSITNQLRLVSFDVINLFSVQNN